MRRAYSYQPRELDDEPRRADLVPAGPPGGPDDYAADVGADAVGAIEGDLPVWQRDAISLSAQARRLIDRIKPILIRVFSFWDHRVTRLVIDDRILTVDASGSYRLE